jgi:hypothetical protein
MATFNISRNNSKLYDNSQFHKNNSNESIHEICLKNGILTAILLVASFMSLCALTNKLQINQLSAANLFIMAFGVYFALENYSPTGKGKSIDYFEGFKIGLYTVAVSVILHAVYIGVYTSIDDSPLNYMKAGGLWKLHIDAFSASCLVLFEGMVGGLILTFCMMQYFKKN